jgi:hypothetical protein
MFLPTPIIGKKKRKKGSGKQMVGHLGFISSLFLPISRQMTIVPFHFDRAPTRGFYE